MVLQALVSVSIPEVAFQFVPAVTRLLESGAASFLMVLVISDKTPFYEVGVTLLWGLGFQSPKVRIFSLLSFTSGSSGYLIGKLPTLVCCLFSLFLVKVFISPGRWLNLDLYGPESG